MDMGLKGVALMFWTLVAIIAVVAFLLAVGVFLAYTYRLTRQDMRWRHDRDNRRDNRD